MMRKLTVDVLSRYKISYRDVFHQNGVYVFDNLISQEKLIELTNEINKIRKIVMAKIANMPRPLENYSDIAERELGRLDYRCGFRSKVFNEIAKPIVEIIKSLSSTIDFRHYWGAIPSLPGSGPTNMHRDVYPFLNITEGVNLDEFEVSLPCYYFTVLMPLQQITLENGPTQFIKGSHKLPIVDEGSQEIYAPLLSPGDVVIFDGRTLHKGSANNSNQERLIAYITFIANWYHDQTFAENNFLFSQDEFI